jgi:hypothetical protein
VFRFVFATLSVAALCSGAGTAQERKPAGADGPVTVEVTLAPEHVPEGLKPGARADLVTVTGKTVARGGQVRYVTSGLARDVEVAAVARPERPADPERPVRVELRVTREQAALVDKAKKKLVNVTETPPGGGAPETKQKPVQLRLELAAPGKG